MFQARVASHVLPSSALTLLSRQGKKFPELPYWPGREGPSRASTEGPGEVLPCRSAGWGEVPQQRALLHNLAHRRDSRCPWEAAWG